MTPCDLDSADRLARLERRLDRERRARIEAESLLEAKSRELYQANQQLSKLAVDLERRVEARTYELAQARERAVQLAERDQLTGLANRLLFARRLGAALTRSAASGAPCGLLLVDLDGFKEINDSLGHEAGDIFLFETAQRLQCVVGASALVARLGGDEFAVICESDASPSTILGLAHRIVDAIGRPVAYRHRTIVASCSIGIAFCPEHASDPIELQRLADIALYASKRAGRATLTVFEHRMSDAFDERQALAEDLRHAFACQQIEPWFQPIVKATTGEVAGAEVLVRWRHPQRGILSPGAFLFLIEEARQMQALFRAVLTAAAGPAERWLGRGLIEHLAINVSPSQLKQGDFASDVVDILVRAGFPPRALVVEITEEVLLLDLDRARQQLETLTRYGVRIALDDFGSGYANLAYLRKLPIDILKLDRTLTAEAATDAGARAIIRAVADIARELDLQLVAEGIETQEQAFWLTELGCHLLQGYLFGRAMPAERFAALNTAGRGARSAVNAALHVAAGAP